ncbi:MAG: DUF4405 domain-containing protein [Candidatus Korarchaeota archaeon]|nr:DUF4405 domain-containing protein [Candidatus Korarchaeota archaeon]
MGSDSKMLKVRAAVSLSQVIVGAVLLLSGVILYFAPHGPGSGEVYLLGLGKHAWETIHGSSGCRLGGLVTLHVGLNFGPLKVFVKRLFGGS